VFKDKFGLNVTASRIHDSVHGVNDTMGNFLARIPARSLQHGLMSFLVPEQERRLIPAGPAEA
jgi:hypothetical protein